MTEFTTGGDFHTDAAIELLYEALNWAAEIGLCLSLAQDGLPKLRQEVVLGLRWLL